MSDIMPSPGELMRQHELASLRDERDSALEGNKRLRELYENVTSNRERFGWTINHLLECEEALRTVEGTAAEAIAESKRLTDELNDVGAECSRLEQDILEIHDALTDPDEASAINAGWIIERVGQLREAIAERDAAREALNATALGEKRGLLIDFCAYLERHHGLNVHSWELVVHAFMAGYLTEGQET